MKSNITKYGNFLNIYQGSGNIVSPNGIKYNCNIECGQSEDGRIICECLYQEDILRSSDIIDDLKSNVNIHGFTNDNHEININNCILAKNIAKGSGEFTTTFIGHDLYVKYNNKDIEELKFFLYNFRFDSIVNWEIKKLIDSVNWTIDGIHISLKSKEILDTKPISRKLDFGRLNEIQSSLNVKLSNVKFYQGNVIKACRLASNICTLLSFSQGRSIDWLYYEAYFNQNEKVGTYFRKLNNIYYSKHSIIPTNFTPKYVDDFIIKTSEISLEQDKSFLPKIISYYISAINEADYLPLNALKLVVLIEYLVAKHNKECNKEFTIPEVIFKTYKRDIKNCLHKIMEKIIENNKQIVLKPEILDAKIIEINRPIFMKSLENFLKSLKLECDRKIPQNNKNELEIFINIRNNLVHTAEFLNENDCNMSTEEQYNFLISFIDRIILGILKYDGKYRDWSDNEEISWDMENKEWIGLKQMKYSFVM